ncbi:hypothetical protein LP52_14630 [Streptomonospora alba]|uniref:Uncharacterized protein n=1 Tax=Streptomonospora alba TaxID=183763 RepID=A0A0C2FFZ3_9ACTN|nr:hypothetical protein [Streptomonospora alba]KIH98164.1 hypothetical protein LP52_14630 [Streptomonospora alba]
MGWRDRFGLRKAKDRFGLRKARKRSQARFDRAAEDSDLRALMDFHNSKVGVEFFVEPETFATGTTAVAVASDGEWIRRRVGSPEVIHRVARNLAAPVHDVHVVGYPQRMRDWTERNKRGLSMDD